MKRKNLLTATFATGIVFASFTVAGAEESLLKQAQSLFSPLPDTPVFKKENPGTPEKIALGKMLFFDTRLSKSNVFSCNSCHNLATAGVDNNPFSTGHQWQVGGRNAPTVLNASLHIAQFWDGRAKDVEAQALGPELNPVEMAATEELVTERLASIPAYVQAFKKAFPKQKNPLTYANVGNAIGAYERTLLTPSPFDRYLKGDENALNKAEKEGLALFIETGCASCHNGVAVGGGMYQKFGLLNDVENFSDEGRFAVTKKEEDKKVFKVPSLRNIERTAPYFSDGREWSLKSAIKLMAHVQLDRTLSDKEAESIETFLKALTGKLQKDVTLPQLPASTDATAKPDRS